MFDYLLDDAAVYAVFNHQIADLPNPQSPYKKDNPKTWGDGTLIDFGDGTAGVAKKLTFKAGEELSLSSLNGKHSNGIIAWGGNVYYDKGSYKWDFELAAYNTNEYGKEPWTFRVGIITNEHGTQGVYARMTWVGDAATTVLEIWVWCIFEYHA